MNTAVRAIVSGLFFLFIFLSGIWLSRTGRPLNVGISTIHKLISLAAGVFLLVTIHQRNRVVRLSATEWIAIVATGLCFLGDVASGGLLNSDKPMPVAVLRVHQVVPVLTLLSTGVTLYLVLGRWQDVNSRKPTFSRGYAPLPARQTVEVGYPESDSLSSGRFGGTIGN
jgi:hypothetical protein